MREVTIRVKPPGVGTWGVLGTDTGPGIQPQGVSLTANEAGPDTCSFTLARDSSLPWTDLLPFTAVEVEVAGSGIVWGGRVWDTTFPSPDTITVNCRGYQYALEDNMVLRTWLHNGVNGFQDVRNLPSGADLTRWKPDSNKVVDTTGGGLRLSFAAGTITSGDAVGVVLDLGAEDARSISVDYVNLVNLSADVQVFLRASNSPDPLTAGTTTDAHTNAMTVMTAPAATITGDFAALRRYVSIFLYSNVTGTFATSPSIVITGVRVFRDTTYRSGGSSDLHADTVIKDTRAALLGSVLSTDESQIEATTFDIPHLSTRDMGAGGYATPRQILTAVNAYHDYLAGVDHLARLYFKQRPTAPETEIGEWAGADFSDAGDSGEELYNRVLVQYTDGTLQPQTEDRTAVSTLLNLGSTTRGKILSVSTPVTQAAAQQIGDTWLASRTRRPTRGSVTVRGAGGARYTKGGAPVNPADYLRLTGSLIRLMHRWSPDDGGWGRDGTIRSVTYTPQTDTATLSIDSERDRLDVLLGRLAAVRGAGIPLS